MAHEEAKRHQMELPHLVFGVVEVRRLDRELQALEEYMTQMGLRGAGEQAALPRVSRLLDALAGENHLNLLQPNDRKELTSFLKAVLAEAPVLHISFAADPSAAFMSKVVEWLRSNIHPFALVTLGLQPTIAAGCIVRTANRSFDFSLRHRFIERKQVLLKAMETPIAPAAVPAPVQTPVQPAASGVSQ